MDKKCNVCNNYYFMLGMCLLHKKEVSREDTCPDYRQFPVEPKDIHLRFEFVIADNKIYLVDNENEMWAIPTSLKQEELTLEDKEQLINWLEYLNKIKF